MRKRFPLILATVLVAVVAMALISGTILASDKKKAGEVERIGPEETREMVAAGEALLICSYSDERCKSILLEGAILRGELNDQISSLPKNQNLIFYCG